MSMDGCSDSRKRSASTALQTSAVRFPPACLSDFVIHYRGTAYHVHKFVLHYHSSYFRAYIDPLVAGQRACAADECDDHPSIAHCIRLPDSCGKVEAVCDDFRLFLCHLYFAQHYSCFPYQAASDIDLTGETPPAVTLTYPQFLFRRELQELSKGNVLFTHAHELCEAVLSLCHYFDCAVVLSRARGQLSAGVASGQQVLCRVAVGRCVAVLFTRTTVRPEATEGGLHPTAHGAEYNWWRPQGGVGKHPSDPGQEHDVRDNANCFRSCQASRFVEVSSGRVNGSPCWTRAGARGPGNSIGFGSVWRVALIQCLSAASALININAHASSCLLLCSAAWNHSIPLRK